MLRENSAVHVAGKQWQSVIRRALNRGSNLVLWRYWLEVNGLRGLVTEPGGGRVLFILQIWGRSSSIKKLQRLNYIASLNISGSCLVLI